MMLRTICIAILISLTGCGSFSDVSEILAKQENVQQYITDNHRLSSQVGWSVQNGELTQVTVAFFDSEVANMSIPELQEIAREAINKNFDSPPNVLNIQVTDADALKP